MADDNLSFYPLLGSNLNHEYLMYGLASGSAILGSLCIFFMPGQHKDAFVWGMSFIPGFLLYVAIFECLERGLHSFESYEYSSLIVISLFLTGFVVSYLLNCLIQHITESYCERHETGKKKSPAAKNSGYNRKEQALQTLILRQQNMLQAQILLNQHRIFTQCKLFQNSSVNPGDASVEFFNQNSYYQNTGLRSNKNDELNNKQCPHLFQTNASGYESKSINPNESSYNNYCTNANNFGNLNALQDPLQLIESNYMKSIFGASNEQLSQNKLNDKKDETNLNENKPDMHQIVKKEELPCGLEKDCMLYPCHVRSIGLTNFLALIIHNFTEGFILAVAAKSSDKTAFMLCVSIIIHNFVEGGVIAYPLHLGGYSKLIAFLFAAVAALIELLPVILIHYSVDINDMFLNIVSVSASGLIFHTIAFEMLPLIFQHDPKNKIASWGLFLGFLLSFSISKIIGHSHE